MEYLFKGSDLITEIDLGDIKYEDVVKIVINFYTTNMTRIMIDSDTIDSDGCKIIMNDNTQKIHTFVPASLLARLKDGELFFDIVVTRRDDVFGQVNVAMSSSTGVELKSKQL